MLASKSLNLNSVAEKFDISRPAISKHIKILHECGLITIHTVGRERYCVAKLEKLSEISDWLERYKMLWTDKLDALDLYLTKVQDKNKKTGKIKNKKNVRKN